ncbi:MAG: peptidylprolyl isomerase [Bacteroidales bacterium]|nr:peptidylprolyl isomerase [Bacteroidales bacterium]
MAVITKIRNYSGLLIAVIGIGLAAFVLGDFLGYGPMRTQRFDVGKADGQAITYMQFENRVQQQLANWQNQTGMSAGPRESFQVRQQVWNEMLREILMADVFESLGIDVTAEELFHMIYSDDPHPILRQSFSDPATGRYEPQEVVNFLRNFNQLDPGVRNQWLMIEEYIKNDQREKKYHDLIGKGYLATSALASADFINRNTSADIRFVYKPHTAIDDDEITISDRELRRVYEEHNHRFRQEASRSISYVSLPVFPSEEDRENTLNEVVSLKEEFAAADNVRAFVNSMSDIRFDPSYYGRGELSPNIDPDIFNMPVGSIIGPYVENNSYVLARLVDVRLRPDSMRASHILIAYRGSAAAGPDITRTYAAAQQKADSILQVVRANPRRFASLATQFSDDPSAAMNQGDLDWFPDGAMVAPFNEAVVENPTGSVFTVETDFGFHVVNVTGKSAMTNKVQVAFLAREILPGNRTYQQAFSQISTFASELRAGKDFDAAAEDAGLNVRQADRIGMMDMTLPGIEHGRQIVQWAFDDNTGRGNVSRIFELENNFVVARLTAKQDKGIPALEDIRSNIMDIAIREKKMAMIADELKSFMQEGSDLEVLAEKLSLEVKEAKNLNFNSRNLPGVGPEPVVIGNLFASGDMEVIGPLKGNNGVFVLQVMRKDEGIVPDDLNPVRRTLQTGFMNRVPGQAFQAIKDNARIEDNRAMFF